MKTLTKSNSVCHLQTAKCCNKPNYIGIGISDGHPSINENKQFRLDCVCVCVSENALVEGFFLRDQAPP